MFAEVLQELARPSWSIFHDFWMLRLSLLTIIFDCCTMGPVQLYDWNTYGKCYSPLPAGERIASKAYIEMRED